MDRANTVQNIRRVQFLGHRTNGHRTNGQRTNGQRTNVVEPIRSLSQSFFIAFILYLCSHLSLITFILFHINPYHIHPQSHSSLVIFFFIPCVSPYFFRFRHPPSNSSLFIVLKNELSIIESMQKMSEFLNNKQFRGFVFSHLLNLLRV